MCLYGDERMRIGEGTRVWDPSGLWGDYVIGEGCTIGKFVEIGDGVRIGDRCKVEAFAFIPPGVVIEDDRGPWGPTFALRTTGGRGRWGDQDVSPTSDSTFTEPVGKSI